MWNHVPAMRSQGGVTPKLKTGSMPDLIAFLFSSRYFLEPGNADRGKRLYESKNCSACHETRRRELGAPDLTRPVEAFSPVTLTAAAWNHGTSMMTTMRQQGLEWPEFKGREMADLIAYLNSRLVVRIASPTAEKKD